MKKTLVIILIIPVLLMILGAGCKTTGTTVKVTFSPEGETTRETSVKIKFSEPVMLDKTKINVPFYEEILVFSPPLKGEYRWTSEDTLEFIPNDKLAADTEYTVTVPKEYFELIKVKGKNNFKFRTPEFKVTNVDMAFDFFIFDIGEKNIIIDITFNYIVDIEDVKTYVKLLNNNEDFPYEIISEYNGTNFRLISANIKRDHKDQKFKLLISKELSNSESGTKLKKDTTRSIRLDRIPPFDFQNAKYEKKGSEIILSLKFNKIPDEKYIENFIEIETDDKQVDFKAKVDITKILLTGKFKYATSYKVKIKKGIKAIDGSELKNDESQSIYIHRPNPEIKFLQEGTILPVKDDVNVFIHSFDVKKINVEIYRVPENNIPHLMHNRNLSFLGKVIYNKSFEIEKAEKDDLTSAITEINLKSFIKKHGKGLYRMRVMAADRSWPRVTKWIIGTDIGLVLKHDGSNLFTFAASLKDFSALAGTEISLLNREGEEILTKITDKTGAVTFENYKTYFPKGLPWLVTARNGEDYSYLSFSESRVNFTNFNIEGAPYKKGSLEAFVYPSRDLFKPGEKVHIAAVVKKVGGGNLQNLPVTLKVYSPNYNIVYEENTALNKIGMTEYSFQFPSNMRTGNYKASLFVGKLQVGSASFKLEEFIPETLKVEIDVDENTLVPGFPMKFNVKGVNLFGTPAADRKVFANVQFSYLPFKPKGYKSFSFENTRFTYRSKRTDLQETKLDANGMIKYECPIPKEKLPHGMLRARIYAEVQQKGGRVVAVVKNVDISDKPYYLGIKKPAKGFTVTGKNEKFEIVALNQNGKPVTVNDVSIYVVKTGWYNIYQKAKWQDSGRYESQNYQEIVLRKKIGQLKGKAVFSFNHETIGAYEIIVIREKDKISSNLFYDVTGEGEIEIKLEDAHELKVKLAKDDYNVGENAQISVKSPFTGLMMLTVEREKVLYRKFVKITKTSEVISIPIKEEYLPNAYVVAMLFRSYNDKNPTLPIKAYAAVPLNVNKSFSKLDVNIDAPDVIRPNSTFDTVITSSNKNEEIFLTLSAVEEGALSITNFHVPDIFNYFMRKRALSVSTYDTFSLVMSKITNTESDLSIGGGKYEASDKHYNPTRRRKKKTVAFWSGVVKMENGRAKIPVKIGSYNGSLRFMVVAASRQKSGSAEKSSRVFAPIIIQPTIPRALSPGDKCSIPVSIFNKLGSTNTINLKIDVEGPLKIISKDNFTFSLDEDEEEYIELQVNTFDKLGNAKINLTASGGGKTVYFTEEISIRPPVVKETIVVNGELKAGKKKTVVKETEYYEMAKEGNILVSPYTEAQYIGRLDHLMRYPYGCLEQKVSMAFPQLYISQVARIVSPFLYRDRKEAYYINDAIKTAGYQYTSNGFDLWPGYRGNLYLNFYVIHFLTEAKKKGYNVKNEMYNNSLKYIKKQIKRKLSKNLSGSDLFNITYGIYILTDAKISMRENMEYIRENLLKEDTNILTRLYLAAAYSKIGDKETAYKILEEKKDVVFPENFSWWGNPYLSDTASISILLLTLLEIDPSNPVISEYTDILIRKFGSARTLNTHEASMGLQVFAKLFSTENRENVKGIFHYGEKQKTFEGKKFLLQDGYFAGLDIMLENKGTKNFYYSYLQEGYSKKIDFDKTQNNGITVKRYLYDQFGQALDLKNIKQGDVVVERIDVSTSKAGNTVIVEIFPGGLEIENPRLKRKEGYNWIPYYKVNSGDYIDIREDRLIIFTDFNKSGSRTYYFLYRAVFPGQYVIPGVFSEDMYNPEIYGRTKANRLFIVTND